MSNLIEFNEARNIAEEEAAINLNAAIQLREYDGELLSKKFLESKYCWMFFRNSEIWVPQVLRMQSNWAYIVTKKGNTLQVADYSNDKCKMDSYFSEISNYCKSRGL